MRKGDFQFKKFLIRQDKCAMKVCTDSCILGASVPIGMLVCSILDIGCGTGLLSLMMAQRSHDVHIDAVEVDDKAAVQAWENVVISPWKERIVVHRRSIQQFALEHSRKYDLIVSNPPFFYDNLLSQKKDYNIACHSGLLSLDELVSIAVGLLSKEGSLVVMLPPYESSRLVELAAVRGLYPSAIMKIKHAPLSKTIRMITSFRFEVTETKSQQQIYIKNPDGSYSGQFVALLKEYYTIF